MFCEAVNKHANHDQFFNALEKYALLYPDQKVVATIPGSDEPFTVEKYKCELSKPYSKVDLYICLVSDIHDCGKYTLEDDHLNIDNELEDGSLNTQDPFPLLDNVDTHQDSLLSSMKNEAGPSCTVERKVYCPVCNKKFTIIEIEQHVDFCLESKNNPLSIYDDSDKEENDFAQLSEESEDNSKPLLTQSYLIQSVDDIFRSKCNISSEDVTISIRRKFCFADFVKHFSKKWNVSKKDYIYKIMFIGEAGIDTGGVSREYHNTL